MSQDRSSLDFIFRNPDRRCVCNAQGCQLLQVLEDCLLWVLCISPVTCKWPEVCIVAKDAVKRQAPQA